MCTPVMAPVPDVLRLVHTADADKTTHFCLVRVGGVNKPLAKTLTLRY